MLFKLNSKDVEYISKKTGLNKQKTVLLTEEEGDLNLVLNEISPSFKKEEAANLSLPIYSKLLIFNKSLTTCWEINEKVYVSDAISKYYPEILAKNQFKSIPKKEGMTETQTVYFFVLYNLYRQKLKKNIFNERLDGYVKQSFLLNDKREVHYHYEKWRAIFNTITEENLLSVLGPDLKKKDSAISGIDNLLVQRGLQKKKTEKRV